MAPRWAPSRQDCQHPENTERPGCVARAFQSQEHALRPDMPKAQRDPAPRGPAAAKAAARSAIYSLPRERLVATLELMWRIRALEEEIEELYSLGRIHGTMHLSIGQEAAPWAPASPLRDDDFITSTHRGHGHCIAKGADLERMMAEFLGQGDRLLPRPRRLDAHRRRLERQPRRQRHRRRRHPDRGRARGSPIKISGTRPAWSRVLLRRRRQQRGRLPRGAEHGRRSGSCRWSSSARTTSTACRSRSRRSIGRRRHRRARRAPTACRASPSTATTCRPSATPSRRAVDSCPRRRRADARRGTDLPLAGHFQVRHEPLPHPRGDRPSGASEDPIGRFAAALVEPGDPRPTRRPTTIARRRREVRARPTERRRVESRRSSTPTASDPQATEDAA